MIGPTNGLEDVYKNTETEVLPFKTIAPSFFSVNPFKRPQFRGSHSLLGRLKPQNDTFQSRFLSS